MTKQTRAHGDGAVATQPTAELDQAGAAIVEAIDGTERAAPRRAWRTWCHRHWAALVVTTVLVTSLGSAAGVYWSMYRPDHQTDSAVQQQVLDAASQGTVASLSYGSETIDKDLAAGKTHLTGTYLTYYSQFVDKMVAPTVKQRGVDTKASVVKAAISELHPDRAVVLVFVNQVTTSKDHADPALATSSVLVGLTKVGDSWLISQFTPV